MSLRPWIFLCLLGAVCYAPLCAQTAPQLPVHSAPVAASAEGSRLRQVESIYQQQLRPRHIPLLGKYLTQLQKLSAQASDPKPYQEEIARVQTMISNGGVVDLSAAAQTLRAPADQPPPLPLPMPRRLTRGLISLTPGLARSITPLPVSSASPEVAALGEIEWRIESLPAGTYEIVLNYACPELASPLPVQLDFAGEKLEVQLDESKKTFSSTTFRILRLGQITFMTEVRGETLRLRAGAKESSGLLLRQLVIAKAKPAP